MKISTFTSLILVAITSLSLFACGGGGGGGAAAGGGGGAPAAPATPALTADKMTAVTPVLINGTTTITFTFGAAYNGSAVTFTSSPAGATLTNGSATVAGGIATVDVSSPAQSNISVTATIAGYTGTKTVQFIPQPDRAVVHVALTRTITDLESLAFGLRSNMGANSPYTSYALAAGYTSYDDGIKSVFLAPGGDLYLWGVFVFGVNVTPSTNLLELTFTPVAAGIPYFEIFTPLAIPGNLSFSRYNAIPAFTSVSTNLATSDFVITTGYYLGAVLLATN